MSLSQLLLLKREGRHVVAREDTEIKLSHKSSLGTKLAFGAGLVLIVVVLAVCINVISRETQSSLDLFMEEVAEVESDNLRSTIEGDFNILHGASAFVTEGNIDDDQRLLTRFREVVDYGPFMRVGVVNLDGRAIAYDREAGELPAQDYSQYGFVKEVLRGEDYVSVPYDDVLSNQKCIAFSVPVYNVKFNGGDPIGAMVGVISMEEFSKNMDVSLFGGHGSVYLIDSQGNILARSNQEGMDETNVLSAEYEENQTSGDVKADLASGSGDSAVVQTADGASFFTIYQPIGVNDWFIDVVVPTEYLEAKNNTVFLAAVFMAVFVVGVVGALMLIILRTRRRSAGALARAALTDRLTGLNNELAFMRACEKHPEYYENGHSLVLFNLVGFSLFNTIYGYQEGSALIRSIASILSADAAKDELLARLSGDRFLMLLDSHDAAYTDRRLARLLDEVEDATWTGESQYHIVAQCCVYHLTHEDEGRDVNLIVQDMAVPLQRARNQAKTRIVVYDERDVLAAMRARQIESIMSTALSKEEFLAYFQPQYNIQGGEPVLCGAEALVRWNSPVLGLVTPDEFIPVFEKNGSIGQIDRYMLERTCLRLRQWLNAGLRCVPVSVNLSRRNLFSADLVDEIERIVDAYEIPHDLIKFELTESIVAESEEQLIDAANKLRSRGFKILMDDFGTGYSAFAALKDVPFDIVKLDRSFFGESITTERGREMLVSVIALLERMGFKVLAEGIETEQEVDLLKGWGCQIIQGYVYGRPAQPDAFRREHLEPAQEKLEEGEA